MQTRDRKYASRVYEQVAKIEEKSKDYRDKYGSMAHKLPVLIRSAGLAQALAFVESRARGETPYKDLLDHLADVVEAGSRDNLVSRSREAGLEEYMALTERVLTALLWFKRFAQSVLDVQAGEDKRGIDQ